MSHHGVTYWIYPEDRVKSGILVSEWEKADSWIDGAAFRGDFKEAESLAMLATRSTQVPFVVVEVPKGGIRPKLCYYWEVLLRNQRED